MEDKTHLVYQERIWQMSNFPQLWVSNLMVRILRST